MSRLLVHGVFAVFKGCEKRGLIHCGTISPCIPASYVSELLGKTGISWLGDARNRVRASSTSHTLDLFHSSRDDCAGNTIDCDLSISQSCALEAPSCDGKFLSASVETSCVADAVNLGVRLHIPTVITSEVAVLSRLTEVGIADAEADLWHRVTWVLVTGVGWEMSDLVS